MGVGFLGEPLQAGFLEPPPMPGSSGKALRRVPRASQASSSHKNDENFFWGALSCQLNIALHCFALYCFALVCVAAHCFALLPIALCCFVSLRMALRCFALFYILHCFVLRCITLERFHAFMLERLNTSTLERLNA